MRGTNIVVINYIYNKNHDTHLLWPWDSGLLGDALCELSLTLQRTPINGDPISLSRKVDDRIISGKFANF